MSTKVTQLEVRTIEAWVECGWLQPENGGLSDIDLARAQLICDLREDLGVNDEGVDVILDLVDQIHGLRRTLRHVLEHVRNPAPTNPPE